MQESILVAGGTFVGLSVLYFAAAVADQLFGQPRSDSGSFGANRTTRIEQWLKRIGALVVLFGVLYLATAV